MTQFQAATERQNINNFQPDNAAQGLHRIAPVANDDPGLQAELELRYGAAFAQWIMDDLRRASMI